ncbi:uncharacterized protein LOC121398310 [Xenopus laevis]|uniref:Uncharacterized protein LOC121398310 n=1 Tax=Xenopus laevis TaxID=8355 RepID=A0A8J1LUX5_XENLA|nr:uncharacterized protein LOC121398310 [Xenopus laevis]
MSSSKQTAVGIFSRCGEDEYLWLVNALRDYTNVCPQPFVITNSNASAFRESVRTNNFAILYHSMNRGRLNITDVTDSLYDDELQVLSSILGKDKVMVIADDIDDSSHNAKNRILHSQPTIKLKAQDLFLFSREDKTNYNILISKMAPIKEIITAASHKSINMSSVSLSLVTYGTTIICVGNALCRPSVWNWALAFPWVAASLGLVRNTSYIPYIPAGLRLSEIYVVPAGVVTILSIFQPDWPHIIISHILSLISYVPNLVTLGCACSDPSVKKISTLVSLISYAIKLVTLGCACSDPTIKNISTLVSLISYAIKLVTLGCACSDPTIKNLSLLFACTMVSLWLRRCMRVPDISHILSLISYVPNLVTLGCACSDPSVKNISHILSLISYAANLVTLGWACSDPSVKNLSLLFACTGVSLGLRRYMRVPDSSVSLSLVTYGTTIICVGNALSRPSVWNWALAFPWVAASLGLVRNTFYIPYIPAGLRLSETYMVPAGVVTILSISQPDWPHVLSSYCTSILQKHKGR